MRKGNSTLLLVLSLALLACTASDPTTERETPRALPLAAPVRSVALFKNGLGFVRREAKVPAGARAVEIELPVPTHGTLGLEAGKGASVSSAVAREHAGPGAVVAANLLELLGANLGRDVELVLAEGETLRGHLISAGVPSPVVQDRSGFGPYGMYYAPQAPSSELVVLRTERGDVALRAQDVRRASADGGPLEMHRSVRKAVLEVALSEMPETEVPLTVTSLERGWSWAPSYVLELREGRARIEARATVFAEVDGLSDATLRFVTGFPNLKYSSTSDPLALQEDLQTFLASLGASPEARSAAGQAVVSQNYARVDAGPADPPAELAGLEAGELFVVERHGVTLARGERGSYPLFEAEVPCEVVYQWKVRDRAEEEREWWRGPRDEDEPPTPEIWHALRLRNDTTQPWTTAPAMTTRDGLVLGQDTLYYTAAGARTIVRITRAVNVQGSRREVELSREHVSRNGDSFELITVEGHLTVQSHERVPVTVAVEKELTGLLKDAPGATQELVGDPRTGDNPRTRLAWELELPPGESAELTYRYEFHVH